jgi:lysyl-tRNA synthetase class 2
MREAIIEFWAKEITSDSRLAAGDPPTMHVFNSIDAFQAFIENAEQLAASAHIANSIKAPRRLQLQTVLEEIKKSDSLGKGIATLFEQLAEEHLIQPTIIYEFPLAVSPLSKQKPDEPDWVERFEFYIGGFELGNAFSELNDPEEQFRRFKEQLEQHERGDEEAHQMDVDYVRALAYGLPPTAGEGIGIDRLTMILTGARSIRDVILFPLLRPQAREPEAGSGKPEASQ